MKVNKSGRSSPLVNLGPVGIDLVDEAEPHYICERTDKDNFTTVLVKSNLMVHHFPNKYENGLRKAHDYILFFNYSPSREKET
jgi:hypothetical protein